MKAPRYLIKNAYAVLEKGSIETDVLIVDGRIQIIQTDIQDAQAIPIDGKGKILIPGMIDAHVHFRDPGFPDKGTFHTESRAALAGGVTSFLDMPNTVPNVLTVEHLQEKYLRAQKVSYSNFGFFLGVMGKVSVELPDQTDGLFGITDDGLYFGRESALLVEDPAALLNVLNTVQCPVAIHSELESVVHQNEEHARQAHGENVPIGLHGKIRSEEACLQATQLALSIAQKSTGRLHLLHLTTGSEARLLEMHPDVLSKKVTSEVCVQNLWFNDSHYASLGTKIKWNPSIKTSRDQQELLCAVNDDRIDLIASDHAPHNWVDKNKPYFQAASGAPMVQHSLNLLYELHRQGHFSLEKMVEKTCQNPALLYGINERGFLREGYWADLVLLDPSTTWTVTADSLLYKCGWSPLIGQTFHSKVSHVWVNGFLDYCQGQFSDKPHGQALQKKSS
jgi:dihydroorotase